MWDQRRLGIAAAGGFVFVALVVGLLVVSPWSGGSSEELPPSDSPAARPSATPRAAARRTPTPTPSADASPTPTGSAAASNTPSPGPRPTPTPAPLQPPTAAVTPTPVPPPPPPPPPPALVPGAYAAVQVLPSINFNLMVDFAVIPGTGGQEAVMITQPGLMYRVSLTEAFAPAAFGDLRDRVAYGGEQGLLSLAFSPSFTSDGRLYVYYTTGSPGPSRLSRFSASASSVNTGSEQVLLEIPQFETNHNGGRLLFGPDGYLYLSTGDGGGGGDPQNNAQNIDSSLGKMLRLNVSGAGAYTVPGDNPFVGTAGLDEIWAYGLRNPWRYSFDRATGALWLGDVGQGSWEEVDQIVRGGNYGWRCYEGFAAYNTSGCPASGFQQPRAVYGHNLGCSITGGYVYRGAAMPELQGWFVYGDFCSGRIWAVNTAAGGDPVLLVDTTLSISSFAELPDGELLILTFNSALYRLAR